MAVVGQGGLTIGPVGEPTMWLLSPPPSGFFSLLTKYNFLVFFWNFLIFRNMVS
jgi:hypothetical protein